MKTEVSRPIQLQVLLLMSIRKTNKNLPVNMTINVTSLKSMNIIVGNITYYNANSFACP